MRSYLQHFAVSVFAFSWLVIVSITLPAFFSSAHHAMAATSWSGQKPLMVIRFNQRRVFYQQPLYSALSAAVNASPAVRFNVVSLVPHQPERGNNQRIATAADAKMQEVLGQMMQMGIPAGQIVPQTFQAPNLSYQEIRIYVE